MWQEDAHISDLELLHAADGELSGRRVAEIQAHLKACPECRARMAEIERAIGDFALAHHQNWEADLPPIERSRAQLMAALAKDAALRHQNSWQRLLQFVFYRRRLAYVGLVLMAGILGGIFLHFQVVGVGAASIPDADLTPGAMFVVTREDVCSTQQIDAFNSVPSSLANTVFEKYGIRNPQPRAYEVDHLITPALGGSTDIRNLWPQPYSAGTWNARVKDALEDHLHQLVCEGSLDLATAQNDIAMDWIAAYKKYFRTDQPLPKHLGFIKDSPFE